VKNVPCPGARKHDSDVPILRLGPQEHLLSSYHLANEVREAREGNWVALGHTAEANLLTPRLDCSSYKYPDLMDIHSL
jgi:hypothetical protein